MQVVITPLTSSRLTVVTTRSDRVSDDARRVADANCVRERAYDPASVGLLRASPNQ